MPPQMNLPFLRTIKGQGIVDAHAVDFVMPDAMFKPPAIAEDLGNRVETIGLAQLRVWSTEDAKKFEEWDLRLPAELSLGYSQRLDDETVDGDDEGETEKYRVYRCGRGEALVRSISVIQNAEAVASIFKAITGNRLKNASYTDMVNLFIESSRLNGTSPGVTRGLLEAMMSEMARWSDDPTLPLRVPLAAGRAKVEDVKFLRLKELPRWLSVFSALGFEDVNAAVQSSLLRSRTNARQTESPMEDLLHL